MNNYDLIYKELCERVDSGELSLEDAEVINEAAAALNDKTRTIKESSIPEVLLGALGGGIGGAVSYAALYGLGKVGLSAAGITSGLKAAGSIVGGGMAAGVLVLAVPVAGLAAAGVELASHLKNKKDLKLNIMKEYKN